GLAVVAMLICASAAAAADAAAPRIAIGDDPPGAALRVLDETGTLPFPIAVRVMSATFPSDGALDRRLAALDARHVPVWLTIPAPATEPDVDGWRSALRALIDSRGATLSMIEIAVDRQPARVARFAVQVASTEVRTTREAIQIGLGGAAMDDRLRREEIYRAELAPYVDTLVTTSAGNGIDDWLRRVDPTATIALTSSRGAAPGGAGGAARRVVDAIFEELGTDVVLHAWPAAAV